MASNQYAGMSMEEAQQLLSQAAPPAEEVGRDDQGIPARHQYAGMSVDSAKGIIEQEATIDGVPPGQLPPHLQKLYGINKPVTEETGASLEEDLMSGQETAAADVPEDESLVHSKELTEPEKRMIRPGEMDKAKHQLKLMGETFSITNSEMYDFFMNPPNLFNAILPDKWTEKVSLNGVSVKELQKSTPELVKSTIRSTYDAMGVEPTLETAEDIEDISLMILSGNFGGSAFLAGGKKLIDTAAKHTDDLKNFWKTETSFNLWGTGGATAIAAATEGSIEDQEKMAHVGNFMGMLTKGVKDLSPIFLTKDLAKKYQEGKRLVDDQKLFTFADGVVKDHLTSMIPKEMVPDVMERVAVVKRIQSIYPDFDPSVGNVIGTEDFKMIQRVTDSKNPDVASIRYEKNKRAINQMLEDATTETDPAQKAMIATALRQFSMDTKLHAEKLRVDIVNMEEHIRQVPGGDVTGVETGKNVREQLQKLKKEYRDTISEMSKRIDPDETARFDARPLFAEVKKLLDNTEPEKVITARDSGMPVIKQVIPDYMRAVSKKSRADGTVRQFTFQGVSKLRTFISDQASKIHKADPTSNVPRVLGDMRKVLDDIIEEKMIHGDASVAERYSDFREFVRVEAYPRYKEGVSGQLLKQEKFGKAFAVTDDEVGPMFWQKGTKGSNLEQFNKTFSSEHEALKKAIPDNDQRVAVAEEVSEIARGALKSHAMRTLQDSLDKSPKSSPLAVIKSWKTSYKDALNAYPEVAEEVQRIEKLYTTFETTKLLRTAKIDELNRSIVEQYSGVEASTVVKDILSTRSTEEVDRTIRDLYKSVLSNDGDIVASKTYDELYPDTIHIDESNPKVREVRRALQESLTQQLVHDSFDASSGFTSGTKLRKLLHDNDGKLRLVYGDAGVNSLKDLEEALILMGNENKPLFQKDLNHMRTTMKQFGMSPASIGSRWYASALGKVGPVYLVSDALTKLFFGVADKHFDRAYHNTMYDLDGFVEVLKRNEQFDVASKVEKTKEELKKLGAEKIRNAGGFVVAKLFNEHMLAVYGKESTLFNTEEERSGDEGELLNDYLELNDNLTGQSSRMSYNFMDMSDDPDYEDPYLVPDVTDEEVEAVQEEVEESMTDTELEDAQAAAEEPTDDKVFVASTVKNSFERVGADPELGLIFAQLESSMGRFTQAETSSAKGIFQFTDGTWEDVVAKHGDELGVDLEEADVLNPEHNALMGAAFLQDNKELLGKRGLDSTPTNLYSMHLLGRSGGLKFLRALEQDRNKPVSVAIGSAQIKANPQLFGSGNKLKTLGESFSLFEKKINKAQKEVQSFLGTEEA